MTDVYIHMVKNYIIVKPRVYNFGKTGHSTDYIINGLFAHTAK